MRVCIIGNSHVACFRQAWNELEEKPSWASFDFFAAAGNALAKLELKDGCMGSTDTKVSESFRYTSGGRDNFRPADYEAVILIGLNVFVPSVVLAISSAVALQCCEDTISISLALPLGLMIRSQTDGHIYVGHVPLDAASQPIIGQRHYTEMYELMKSAFDRHGMRLLRQPAETVMLPCNTPLQYSEGARQLIPNRVTGRFELEPEGKRRHMNVRYGELYLRDVLKRLEADASAKAAGPP